MPRKKKLKPPKILKGNFGGVPNRVATFDPEEKFSAVLYGGDDTVLAVAWDKDDSGHGFWRIIALGIKDGKLPVMKRLEKEAESIAFYGEVSILGSGKNDLYTSYSYEDDDIVDAEGNIVNKVKEVRIRPTIPE